VKTRPGIGSVILALSMGTALNPLNASMIAVALGALRTDFAVDVATVTWVITAYFLTSAATQPLAGKLSDKFGPRRVFTMGMAIVCLSCLLGAFSPTFPLLCLARAAMALGSSAAYPCALTIVGTLAERTQSEPTRALGHLQMANTSAAAAGPVVGGLLVSVAGWQPLFLINIPLALFALILVARVAPADPVVNAGHRRRLLRELDIPGVLTFVISILLVMVSLLDAIPAYRWPLLAAGVLSAALFVWHEHRSTHPFVNLRMLGRNRPLVWIYLGFIVVNAIYFLLFFGLPQLLQDVAGFDPALVGLLMLPMAAVSVLITPLTVRAINTLGVRAVMIYGATALVIAVALLFLLVSTLAVPLILVLVTSAGIPLSAAIFAHSQGMYASAKPEKRGVAAGIFQTCRYLGAMTATVLIGVTFSDQGSQSGWGVLVAIMFALSAVAVLLALRWRAAV
jgi:MFS family permease